MSQPPFRVHVKRRDQEPSFGTRSSESHTASSPAYRFIDGRHIFVSYRIDRDGEMHVRVAARDRTYEPTIIVNLNGNIFRNYTANDQEFYLPLLPDAPSQISFDVMVGAPHAIWAKQDVLFTELWQVRRALEAGPIRAASRREIDDINRRCRR